VSGGRLEGATIAIESENARFAMLAGDPQPA
jgi:acyl dehydratase